MNTLQTVVAGVDFSDYSQLVVQQAQLLAKELHLSMVVVFCYEDFTNYSDDLILDPEKLARLYEEKVRRHYHLTVDHKVVVRFGRPHEELIAVAKKQKDPLILIGHRGHHAVARFFLGSVAEKLSVTTDIPVWIHRGEKTVLPHKILVPSDLSAHSEKAIAGIETLQKALKSEMEIYHVLTEPVPILDYQAWSMIVESMKKADDQKLREFEKKHPKMHVTRSQGPVAACIENHSQGFDLLALSPQHKSKFVFGRISSKVIRSGDTPVLIVP